MKKNFFTHGHIGFFIVMLALFVSCTNQKNADHQAGMRYLVITAKHHDGFAVYDSDVSDYNIIDATPFDRDPMMQTVYWFWKGKIT